MLDYNKLHTRKRAIFKPKRTDDLRPEIQNLIGREFVFQCTDYGYEDGPYPGQYRWYALADGEQAVGRAWGPMHPDIHHWVPDEDLIDVA